MDPLTIAHELEAIKAAITALELRVAALEPTPVPTNDEPKTAPYPDANDEQPFMTTEDQAVLDNATHAEESPVTEDSAPPVEGWDKALPYEEPAPEPDYMIDLPAADGSLVTIKTAPVVVFLRSVGWTLTAPTTQPDAPVDPRTEALV